MIISGISRYLKQALLESVYAGQPYTPPDHVYLALYQNDPTEFDTGTEVSGPGYERFQLSLNAIQFNDNEAYLTNDGQIEMTAEGTWGTVSHIGIHDAATDGNLLHFGALETAREFLTNDVFRIPDQGLQIGTIDEDDGS